MNATVTQSSFVPGATFFLRSTLTEYGVPLAYRARVSATIDYPDKTRGTVWLSETEPGIFTASLTAAQSGVYTIHFLAEGGTSRGTPFTREHLATAAVWPGGDRPPDRPVDPTGGSGGGGIDWCGLLTCLLSEKNLSREIEERLLRQGVNLQGIRECVKRICGKRPK